MTYSFRPRGVCSQEMRVEVDDQGIIQRLEVLGGCSGNLQGIASLVKGMPAQEAIARLKGIRCEHLRAEDAGRDKKHREKYDYVTARAVARLSVLSEYCLPLAKKGGQFIALKGSKFAEEITEGEAAVKILGGKILSAEPVKLPGLDDGRAIIKIAKIKSTPAQYPRKAGTPEKQPLGAK
mgnify:CR=1 FL=1